MASPVPTRFSERELAVLDALVADGVARNRSDVVRLAVARLADETRRSGIGEAIAASYRDTPQTADDDALAMANANALTEAEPW
jgi:Arc/MetJ-type ribon-helix-helix transcriptional regulator